MKLKKIISAVSALAMTLSMFAAFNVAEAASLGGKPTITAEFAGYEIDTEYDNEKVAVVKFTIDISAAESLAAYAESGKGANKVKTGNGITTLGAKWDVSAPFEYWDDSNDTVLTLAGSGLAVTFGPKSDVKEYCVDDKLVFSVRYAPYDADASGKITLTDFTVDGKNTTEAAVWSYAYLAGTADMVSCDIPSYNEWVAGGDEEELPADRAAAVSFSADENTYVEITKGAEVKNYFLPSNVKADATVYGLLKYTVDGTDVKSGDIFTIKAVNFTTKTATWSTNITVE